MFGATVYFYYCGRWGAGLEKPMWPKLEFLCKKKNKIEDRNEFLLHGVNVSTPSLLSVIHLYQFVSMSSVPVTLPVTLPYFPPLVLSPYNCDLILSSFLTSSLLTFSFSTGENTDLLKESEREKKSCFSQVLPFYLCFIFKYFVLLIYNNNII